MSAKAADLLTENAAARLRLAETIYKARAAEYIRVSTELRDVDAKAQGIVTISGIFLGGDLAFL